MMPRPILKSLPPLSSAPPLADSSQPRIRTRPKQSVPLLSPHVHFPPTPSIVSCTVPTHSPNSYDRAPIIVSPNNCALPERGGRVLFDETADHGCKGSYFHPRAFEACQPEFLPTSNTDSPMSPPDLTFSSSSEDDSDGYGSPTPALSPIGQLPFLPYAGTKSTRSKNSRPSKPPLRRRHTGGIGFKQPSLDGCLGGF